MKFIHTSDWHLGHSLYGFDTTPDQKKMLVEIEKVCLDEQPDLLLIAGDIFDIARPGMAVQKMFVEAVYSLRNKLPDMKIVIIAGNHDSASLHEVFTKPWSDLGVNIVGEASPDVEDMASRRVVVKDKGIVIPIPYFSERFMDDGYISRVIDEAKQHCDSNLPVITMLHTTITGSDFTGHDTNENYIGGIAGINVESLGNSYDYMALGHIHKPQNITERVRYSGAARMMSFDEKYPHGVSVIEIDKRGDMPKIRDVELPSLRKLMTIPADGFATLDEITQSIESLERTNAFIRLNVKNDESIPPLKIAEFRKTIAEKGGTLCVVNKEQTSEQIKSEERVIDLNEFKHISPIEIADRYFKSCGTVMSETEKKMFIEVMKIVEDKERS